MLAAAGASPPDASGTSLFELPISRGARAARVVMVLVLDAALVIAGIAMMLSYIDKRDHGSGKAVGARRKALRDSLDAPRVRKRRTPAPGPGDDAETDGEGKPPRRLWAYLALTFVLGGGVAALVFLGRANAGHYYFSCQADRVVAARGRSFPPWGTTNLGGAAWKAIKIPPSAECVSAETEDRFELETRFIDALVEQATARLAIHATAEVDEAEQQLNQALLLSRAPERRDRRKDVERLLGDVVYWRAAAQVESSIQDLERAARTFDDATARRPRHASDGATWAEHVRAVIEELRRGPAAMRQTSAAEGAPPFGPPPGAPVRESDGGAEVAPPGVLLPLDLDAGTPPKPADAALPTGGVLL